MDRKYWLHLVLPASFFSLFSFALLQVTKPNVDRLSSLHKVLNLPVLEPDLDHPHVEARVLAELFPHVPGGLGAVVVGVLEGLELLGGYGGPWSLVRLVSVQALRSYGGRHGVLGSNTIVRLVL